MKNRDILFHDINHILYFKLIEVARAKDTISYVDLCKLRRLRGCSRLLFQFLDDISIFEHQQGRPMLSAVVVSSFHKSPGNGFFNLAHNLGVYQLNDDPLFWSSELFKVHNCWSSS